MIKEQEEIRFGMKTKSLKDPKKLTLGRIPNMILIIDNFIKGPKPTADYQNVQTEK